MRELTYLLRNNMQLRIILTFALQDHILQHKNNEFRFLHYKCTENASIKCISSA